MSRSRGRQSAHRRGPGGWQRTADRLRSRLASALSYAFVGRTPSETLLDLAQSGALASPQGLEAAARELLTDPRAPEVPGIFAEQWLAIDGLEQAQKSSTLSPEYWAKLATRLIGVLSSDHCHSGIATSLTPSLRERARLQGAEDVYANAKLKHPAVQHLCEKLGFQLIGLTPDADWR